MPNAGKYKELPSYFMECLGYNCTDEAFAHDTWTDVIRNVLFQIWDGLQGEEPDEDDRRWLEVNECFYLFHGGQKWSRADGRGFAHAAWNHLGLK